MTNKISNNNKKKIFKNKKKIVKYKIYLMDFHNY